MGYIRHKGLIVTGGGYKEADKALRTCRASIIKELKSEPILTSDLSKLITSIRTGVNGVKSFAVLPDGSKEGWDDSNRMDNAIDNLLQKIKTYRYDDGSSPLRYGYVQFYDDNDEHWLICK